MSASGYWRAIVLHADVHPRMDDRAERLPQHERQAAVVELVDGDAAARARRLASKGTSGLTQSSSVDALVERDRRVQRLVERAVDVVFAVDVHRREQARAARSTPRSRARSARDRDPARRRSPTRRCRDWSRPGTACVRSLRKSLVRPGAANSRDRKSSIARLSNTPVGIACASVANDSITPRWNGSRRYCSVARAREPRQRRAGGGRTRRMPGAGRSRASAPRRRRRR